MSGARFLVIHAAETIRGGIATYLREITALQVRRFGVGRVAVVVVEDQINDLGTAEGVVVCGVRRGHSRLHTAIRVRRAACRLMAEHPTRLLHIHSSFAGMVCRAPFLRPRDVDGMVYCPHGWAFVRKERSSLLAVWIERFLVRRTDAVVCVSMAGRSAAVQQGLPEKRLFVIQNGLPDRPFTSIPDCSNRNEERALRLLFLGRLDRQKGFDVLVAAARLAQRPLTIDVFGESVLGGYQTDNIPDEFRLHGWQSFREIEPYLLACDAVVMPSRWEGLPMSAVEAMRAAKPIIGSHIDSIAEVVIDGDTGVLVPSDDPVALANAIDLTSAHELADMGQRARKRFLAQFRIEQCEADLAMLYEKVLGGSVL